MSDNNAEQIIFDIEMRKLSLLNDKLNTYNMIRQSFTRYINGTEVFLLDEDLLIKYIFGEDFENIMKINK